MKTKLKEPVDAAELPLHRLATIYLLRLYRAAALTQRPLRLLLKERTPLALALGAGESALARRKPPGIARMIERRLGELEGGMTLPPGVTAFSRDFGLGEAEARVLLFAATAALDSCLDDAIPSGSTPAGRDLLQIVSAATALDARAVRDALAPQSLLVRSGLVRRQDRSYDLSDRLELLDGMAAAVMEEAGRGGLAQRWLAGAPAAALGRADIAYMEADVEVAIGVIRGALARGARGVQILLHGEPGVGKTELSRLVAAEAGASAYLLPDARSDGAPLQAEQRLRRYAFMQRLLAHRRDCVLLLDEVEDMLAGEHHGWGAPPSSALKSWKNRLLEDSEVPGIWTANWIRAIDPALLRRFTLVLHVRVPPARVRLSMLSRGGSRYADDVRIRSLISERDDISPADIQRARVAADLASDGAPATAPDRFLRALSMRAAGSGDPIQPDRRSAPSLPYRLDWLDTDPPLRELVPLLARLGGARLCFWGPPGTGKTALAKHLAQELGRPLHLKKASDLVSCWHGQTERNLAEAFAAARREDALLLLDEADSFLRSREGATRGFEVSEVNQLLKELEAFDGLVALCTNFFDNLDAAVLRRLDLKVRFGRLQAHAAQEAFVEAAATLGAGATEVADVLRVHPLPGGAYALGDVSVAMRQSRLRAAVPGAGLLRDCLEAERRTRVAREGRPIGFTS